MRNILQSILAVLARIMLRRYRPTVIGITGNVGKTSTKDAIAAVLGARFSVRKSEKSYNNELGVPLTVLGITSGGKNVFGWLARFFLAAVRLIGTRYPRVLVLEMGVDKPNDMEYLLGIVKPDIAVFTSLGDMPVHVENFISREALVTEKLKLASAVSPRGHVVYNADVASWQSIKGKTKATLVTYGFSEHADVRISPPETRFAVSGAGSVPLGIACKIQHKGSIVPFRLDGVMATDGAYLAGAACAVGSILGMHLVDMASAFGQYAPPRGRLRLLDGIRGSLILDDTYNSSPSSLDVALAALGSLPARRRIAVMGDMLELGGFTERAHREMGEKASKMCDVVYVVGLKTKFAYDELVGRNFKPGENLFSFSTSQEAAQAIYPAVKEGDMILVKGSQGMRMEKVVKEILAEPEHAENLLVRQDPKWLKI
ncbi:hypothetical protein A3C91_03540 [Candidatus Azambacteria bacterium RIFCSPHIGHO2_02_FULL_52_12]|uniref:UDP-N-acetylmuramoyl-tripeptide--D-alanyl-D-alanine ligase n=1 Tax=Candidatus Azambacteria bacterium RIFCSPLOWO2_01_FULL_46_25 TaxID=1797298 RepID=A0A1F5BVZ3_9BACT|nr:MAG: hypothetical protein A3C91_03540 [Candidatus Azambacteria bacterium RIFCSPHIGHO2_02_FULL_52_12]OGD34775.1 MAG: hypothetical protein A2988_04770 [Candidatus Azambacteria bacterium RIFCSPLOWO2_01_FULL_46_25]OGD36458.1 MAG: hypothetical protein A2850_00765 [Candidatus Azambacteria bacterium RIFCSPHIGHO2_01_FULL_51_74]